MNLLKKKSDREVVEELRRAQRWRRPAGVAFIVLGLVLLALHVWGVEWTRRKVLRIADVSDPQPGFLRDVCHNSALLAYSVGFGTGLSLGLKGALGAVLFFSGLRLCFGGRKDRLLLEHFDGRNRALQGES
jgi:hypothetical protein